MKNARLLAAAAVLTTASPAPAQPAVGEPAPEFHIKELVLGPQDREVTLESLRGEVVALEFWATWCAPCIEVMPHMNELEEVFGDQGVRFISITPEDRETVVDFLENRREIKGWVALDDEKQTWDVYGVRGIPRVYIIGADGRLLGETHPQNLKAEHLRAALEGERIQDRLPDPGRGMARTQELEAIAAAAPADAVWLRETPEPDMIGRSEMVDGAYAAEESSVRSLLREAWAPRSERMDVQTDLPEQSFDVVIRVEGENREAMRPKLRTLLTEQFGLVVTFEDRMVEGRALAPLQSAPPSMVEGAPNSGMMLRAMWSQFNLVNGTMEQLAAAIENLTDTITIDQTGLEGGYDLSVELDAELKDAPPAARTAHMAEALEKQHGLRLEPRMIRVEYLVVRRAGE